MQRPNVRSTHHLPEYREAPVLRLGAHAPTGPEKADDSQRWSIGGYDGLWVSMGLSTFIY